MKIGTFEFSIAGRGIPEAVPEKPAKMVKLGDSQLSKDAWQRLKAQHRTTMDHYMRLRSMNADEKKTVSKLRKIRAMVEKLEFPDVS
jgi:hypothetical protein